MSGLPLFCVSNDKRTGHRGVTETAEVVMFEQLVEVGPDKEKEEDALTGRLAYLEEETMFVSWCLQINRGAF